MEHFTPREERRIRFYFLAGILFKGAISAAEIIVGSLALIVPVTYVSGKLVRAADFLETSRTFHILAPELLHIAGQLAAVSSLFIAIYLISRGVIKLVLIVALILDQLWAYPLSIVAMGLLVSYQLYQIAVTHAGVIVALTCFDLIVIWLIWEEYEVLRSHRATRVTAATAPAEPDTPAA